MTKQKREITKEQRSKMQKAAEEAKAKLVIKLNNDYEVWEDFRQYILHTPEGYYYFSNITTLIYHIFSSRLRINLQDTENLKEILVSMDKAEKYIADLSAKLEKLQLLGVRAKDYYGLDG